MSYKVQMEPGLMSLWRGHSMHVPQFILKALCVGTQPLQEWWVMQVVPNLGELLQASGGGSGDSSKHTRQHERSSNPTGRKGDKGQSLVPQESGWSHWTVRGFHCLCAQDLITASSSCIFWRWAPASARSREDWTAMTSPSVTFALLTLGCWKMWKACRFSSSVFFM